MLQPSGKQADPVETFSFIGCFEGVLRTIPEQAGEGEETPPTPLFLAR